MSPKADEAPPEGAETMEEGRAVPATASSPEEVDLEDADTELAPIQGGTARHASAAQLSGELNVHTLPTTELSAEEAAQHVARSLVHDSVELTGEEAEQAIRLAETLRSGEPTAEVDPDALPRLTHECRMCGEKIAGPARQRFNMPPFAGYQCQHCGNVFCGDHVVRVSGFLETLFRCARFSCPLCLPESRRA